MEKRKIKDWFDEIILGETITRKLKKFEIKDGNKERLKVINPKSIIDGRIIDDKIEYYTYDDEAWLKSSIKEDKYTKLNDIVVKLIEPYSAVIIDEAHTGLVVPSFCLILRGCKEEINNNLNFYLMTSESNSKFIWAYLNSPAFLDEIKKESDSRRRPGRIVTLSKPIICNVEIPIFSRRSRNKLIDAYEKMSKNIVLANELINLQKEYFVTVFDQACNDNLSDAFEDEDIKYWENKKIEEKENEK